MSLLVERIDDLFNVFAVNLDLLDLEAINVRLSAACL
jgi:hypothetical protein